MENQIKENEKNLLNKFKIEELEERLEMRDPSINWLGKCKDPFK